MQPTTIKRFQAGSTVAALAGALLGLAMSPDYDRSLRRSAPRQELHVISAPASPGRSGGPGLAVVVADTLAPAERILRRATRTGPPRMTVARIEPAALRDTPAVTEDGAAPADEDALSQEQAPDVTPAAPEPLQPIDQATETPDLGPGVEPSAS